MEDRPGKEEVPEIYIHIKVCGITKLQDALLCESLGIDSLGFIFYPRSSRFIQPEEAKRIINRLGPFINKVGVFVNEKKERVLDVGSSLRLDTLQLQGEETQREIDYLRRKFFVIKALRVKDKSSLTEIERIEADAILLDTYSLKTYGGTGRSFDWKILKELHTAKRIIVSGGLTPYNIRNLFKFYTPYGVDISSGVEKAPGIKDKRLLLEFIKEVRT